MGVFDLRERNEFWARKNEIKSTHGHRIIKPQNIKCTEKNFKSKSERKEIVAHKERQTSQPEWEIQEENGIIPWKCWKAVMLNIEFHA